MRMASALLVIALVLTALVGRADQSQLAVPATMKAIRIHEYGGPDTLKVETVPTPRAGPGQVLVEVHAASVNPVDWKIREGWLKNWWPLPLPLIPGRDAAGIVRSVGAGVSQVKPGDQVAVYLANSLQGGYAEYAVATARDVVPKPRQLSFEEAAAYPLVAMTAWQALALGRLEAGEQVLVHGGAGGVGSFVVQLAHLRNAHVIATASSRNAEFLRSIGADEVVDYRATPFENVVRDVDLVVDTVGGETLTRSLRVVKRGGRIVTVADSLPQESCAQAGVQCLDFLTSSDDTSLREVTRLIDEGKVKVFVDAAYPLEQAAAAQEKNREGRTRGKIVLKVR